MRETTTVFLAEMAERLTEEFELKDPISSSTPYWWWKQQKAGDLPIALPEPIRFVGRSPVFLWRDIRRWYIAYKGIEAPKSA